MDVQEWVQEVISTEGLPPNYAAIAHNYFLPLADQLVETIQEHRANGVPFIIGVNGAQGTGKTTFAKFLTGYWTEFCGLNGAQISLDDFYLTREERAQRARDIHPLFATRGVPGTHDTDLAISTLRQLKALIPGESLAIPSFDKAIDDRKPKPEWPIAKGAQDFIIFEGWCVGSRPVSATDLKNPINKLEYTQDPKGIWRSAVNHYLALEYQTLFAMIDTLVFLKAPDFETVLGWRQEQEEMLVLTAGKNAPHIMSPKDIGIFIQYFERITRDNLRVMPDVAGYVFEFDTGHQIINKPITLPP